MQHRPPVYLPVVIQLPVIDSILFSSQKWLVSVALLLALSRAVAQPIPLPSPANRLYSVAQLRADFTLLQNALQEAHPGLYRYYPRDSVLRWFEAARQQLTRPLTELQFRRVVEPAIDRLGCGHTDLFASKAFSKYRKKHPLRAFPVDVFVLNNRLFVRENRSTDTTVRRGTEILAVNGKSAGTLLSLFYRYISSDGYNQTFKPFVLNTGLFSSYYALAVGTDTTAHRLTLRDSTGLVRTLTFRPRPDKSKVSLDSVEKRAIPAAKPRPARPAQLPEELPRTLTFSSRDSSVAILKISSFSGGGQRAFFRQNFREVAQKQGIKNLVIDVRGNLGGSSGASLNLVSYLVDKPFQAYTQVDAPVRQVSFNRQLSWKFWRFWLRHFFTRRTPEGTFRRTGVTGLIQPTRKNAFRGRVYVLTNGGTFSAASIFASLAKRNVARVTTVGRETGGGEYGCNAFTSPYLTLPQTGVQLRLPLCKIVLAITGTDQGRGLLPDVPVAYTREAILAAQDLDMERVYDLIKAGQ